MNPPAMVYAQQTAIGLQAMNGLRSSECFIEIAHKCIGGIINEAQQLNKSLRFRIY